MFGLGMNELLVIGFIVFDMIVVMAVLVWALGRRSSNAGGADAKRIAELEREVADLKRRQNFNSGFGSAPPSPFESPFGTSSTDGGEIEDLLRRGQKIQAIKLYRERTGVGLKEAKDAVEEIQRRMI